MIKFNYLIGNKNKIIKATFYAKGDESLQIEYTNLKVQKIICDTKQLKKKVGLEIGKKVILRLNQLKATENFNMYLTQIRLGNPHPLSGNFYSCYAISITANYRLIVEPMETKLDMESLRNCKKIDVKGVVDYHDGKNTWIIP